MLALVPSDARARGRSHRARPWLEHLEPRALLSRAELPIAAALPAAQVQGTAPTRQRLLFRESLHQHQLIETIKNGRVKKVPMFYAPYTGPRLPALDVVGAKGRIIHGYGFVFTGRVLGAIDTSQQSYYVFGINRGGASPPGPFPDRPMIDFDAEIVVQTSPDGYEGSVQLLNPDGTPFSTVGLPFPQVVFNNNQVQVYVPSRDLPSSSPPGTANTQNHYSYAFWAGTSPSDPKGIAGFVPENMVTSIVATGFLPP